MCRISGVVSNCLQKDILQTFVDNMCRVQKHGGPDDEGMYVDTDTDVVLGHCRLSIIDVSSNGHQPMSYLDKAYTISFNGEIYNYRELKATLSSFGYAFNTNSDTEVILAAYDKWGVEAFKRFNGMFAFAIFDSKKKELVVARDVTGIKPLYYASTTQMFAFASEVRALKQLEPLQKENENWKIYLMAYGHLPEPVTTVVQVKPLAKGTYIKYNVATGKLVQHSFERLGYFEKIANRQQAISLIKDTLTSAVTRHLISDAPIGVFLSGGLDSGVIASLASRQLPKLDTVSIYFDDAQYSEKKYQEKLVKQLPVTDHSFLLTEADFHQALPGVIKAMDLPCCDGINTWFISKYARQSGLKTVLSGIGGDELFGGYPSFDRIKIASVLSLMPALALKASRFSLTKKIRRLGYLNIPGAVGKYLFLRGQFSPVDIAAHLGATEEAVWKVLEQTPHLPDLNYLSAGNQASWLETNMYMQNQLLRDADVMSMAHGLEIRVPFLDKEFVKLLFSIHSDIKYSGKMDKQLLIDSFKDALPAAIWKRPKMGFSFPFAKWFGSDMYAALHNGALAKEHAAFKKGQLHWSHFFSLMLLQLYSNEQ